MTPQRLSHRLLIVPALAAALLLVLAASAAAKTYTDVSKSHWARSSINSVTERKPYGYRVLDDFGTLFRPERAITREHLARAIILASMQYRDKYTPVAIKDVPKGRTNYTVIQLAVTKGYLGIDGKGNFRPTETVTASQADIVFSRWLADRYSTYDWSLLKTLHPSAWQPNPGWKTGAPSFLPAAVASRQLQLRYNHPSGSDAQETLPGAPIDRAEIAYMLNRAFAVKGSYQLSGLAGYKKITFPALSDRQKQVVAFALKYIGYPYVWAGEYPTTKSPYGAQKSGGFDCSGFVFYVMKMHFGYPITVNERGASDMAAKAKTRITRNSLKCGDLIFFGPKGPKSSVGSIYHAGLYLGNGWFIHSTGSSAGVTLTSLNDSDYWKTNFAWGRRLLTAAELKIPTPLPSPTPTASASAAAKSGATPAPQASTASPSASASPSPGSPSPAAPSPSTSGLP